MRRKTHPALDIVIRLLMPSRLQRYRSADELLSDLNQMTILQATRQVQTASDQFTNSVLYDLLPLKSDWYQNEQTIEAKHREWLNNGHADSIEKLSSEAAYNNQIYFGLTDDATFDLSNHLYSELEQILKSALIKAIADAHSHFPETKLQVEQDELHKFIRERVDVLTRERTEAAIVCERIEGRLNIAHAFMTRHYELILLAVRQMLYLEISKLDKPQAIKIFQEQRVELDQQLESDVREIIQKVASELLEASPFTLYFNE